MELGDSVSSAGLAWYPQAALVVFVAIFAAVAARVVLYLTREECARAASLPLDDGARHEGGDHVDR